MVAFSFPSPSQGTPSSLGHTACSQGSIWWINKWWADMLMKYRPGRKKYLIFGNNTFCNPSLLPFSSFVLPWDNQKAWLCRQCKPYFKRMFARNMGKLLPLIRTPMDWRGYFFNNNNSRIWGTEWDSVPVDKSTSLQCAMSTWYLLPEARSHIWFNFGYHYEKIILTICKTSSFGLDYLALFH